MSAVEVGFREALANIVVQCMSCGTTYPGTRPLTSCPTCGGLLDVALSLPPRISPTEIDADQPQAGRHSGVWRYRRLLPPLPDDAIVSMWEGNTPLYQDARLDQYAGLETSGPSPPSAAASCTVT